MQMNHTLGILSGTHMLTPKGYFRMVQQELHVPVVCSGELRTTAPKARCDWYWADSVLRIRMSTGDQLALSSGQPLLSGGRVLLGRDLIGRPLDNIMGKNVIVEDVVLQPVTARVFRFRFLPPGHIVCRGILIPFV